MNTLTRTISRNNHASVSPMISARAQRRLVAWLRRASHQTPQRHALAHRHEVLLYDRIAAVRTTLADIALLIEHAPEIDRDTAHTLRRLLSDGCHSPLLNPAIHPSELLATLYYVRTALEHSSTGAETPGTHHVTGA